MKKSKSPVVSSDLTTPQKKLKQARLPFKLLSDDSPKPDPPPSRKRKLSGSTDELTPKVGKISKENDLVEDLVIISDEDSIGVDKSTLADEKAVNPLAKLVDKAWKKKLQKTKVSKKKKGNKAKCVTAVNGEAEISKDDVVNDVAVTPKQTTKGVSQDRSMTEGSAPLTPMQTRKGNSQDRSMTEGSAPLTPKQTTKGNSQDRSMTEGSALLTPKQTTKGNSQDRSMTEGSTPLTPKQLQRKLESAKKKEEREKEKIDREKKRQQEKEERDKIKKEKEDTKKKEREEKEEAKKKEREEKERQKELEKKIREEKEELKKKEREEKEEQKKKEREEKEEQRKKEREAREEEKRKMDIEKQEQQLKKKKAAEAFVNFFVPKQKIDKDNTVGQVSGNTNILSSFAIKTDMRLAPTVRSYFDDERKSILDRSIETQEVDKEELYISLLKNGKLKPGTYENTWPLNEKDDDVMIVEDELPPIDGDGTVITCESVAREKMRPKLFRFHENRRPPYWGTWRKKSAFVKPRRPFGQDEKLLDYTIDSDDEWEEEAEGESLDGSVLGSDCDPQEDEYELDNDVFVPHGYLSDEEATMDEEDVLKLSPDAQKARLKHLEDEFETELKKPTEKLKPRLYGLIWETSDGKKPEKCVDALWNYLGKFAMMVGDMETLLKPAPEPEEGEKKKTKKKKVVQEGETTSPKLEKKRRKLDKEKTPKIEKKTKTPDAKKNQLGINTFLKKIQS